MLKNLFECFTNWNSDGFCSQKTAEVIVSFILLIVTAVELPLVLRVDGWELWPPRAKHVIIFQIFLTLLFNMLHAILFQIRVFFYLEIFFFNLYFLAIVFYFTNKLLANMFRYNRKPVKALKIGYGIMIGIYCVSLIVSIVVEDQRCEQIWYIVIRFLGIVLAIVFIIIGKVHGDKEQKKIISFENIKKFHNPLPYLRIWITLNVISQAVSLINSIVFSVLPSIHCKYDIKVRNIYNYRKNPHVNEIIAFLILILTFYFPIGSSLYIFWVPCKKDKQLRPRQETHEPYRLDFQMIPRTVMQPTE